MLKDGVYIKKVKIPVFRTSLWIIISSNMYKAGETIEDLSTEKLELNSVLAYTYAYTQESGKYRILVFLKPTTKPGTIAHEALHVTSFVNQWHGVKPSFANDEAQAYLLDWVVTACHKAIGGYKKEKKKGV
jgi:hypothetical protein